MNNILLFCKLGFILKNICYFNPVCVYKNTKICLSRDYFIVFENVTLTVKKYPSKWSYTSKILYFLDAWAQ